MAKQFDGQDPSFKAYDDLSSSQYLFVVMNGDDIVDVCGAITDVIVGVLQTEGVTGEGVVVRVDGHTKIIFGENSVTAGALLSTDAAGKAISRCLCPRRPAPRRRPAPQRFPLRSVA